ncbi:MAG TPA: hypothetical protein VHT05_12925 [Candidatus Elarobacter sp.]|nr:hypothetical protein [Candidatus Elarobacter sp.]
MVDAVIAPVVALAAGAVDAPEPAWPDALAAGPGEPLLVLSGADDAVVSVEDDDCEFLLHAVSASAAQSATAAIRRELVIENLIC